jgi:hypothetical protein
VPAEEEKTMRKKIAALQPKGFDARTEENLMPCKTSREGGAVMKSINPLRHAFSGASLLAVVMAISSVPALAQNVLPKSDPPFGGVIGPTYRESREDYPESRVRTTRSRSRPLPAPPMCC